MGLVYDDTHRTSGYSDPTWNLDRGRGGERFSSKIKIRNSRRNGKIDLPCISVRGGTGLYYCQQIVPCPSSKIVVKDLVSVNLFEFNLTAVVRSAVLCI